jgi:hypothetical protein
METQTAPRRDAAEASRDEVARLVLEWNSLATGRTGLVARGATASELDEHRRTVDRVQRRLRAAVKRCLAADPQLTRRMMLRAFELG